MYQRNAMDTYRHNTINKLTHTLWFIKTESIQKTLNSLRGVLDRKQDSRHKKLLSNPKYKRLVFLFKIILPESNTLSRPSSARLHALLQRFSAASSSRPSWWLPRPENSPPWLPPWVWRKRKKITRNQVGWVGRLLQQSDVHQGDSFSGLGSHQEGRDG